MQTIELNPEEMSLLREVLRHAVNELETEVFRTDTHDYKEMLKHRRAVLETILHRIDLPVHA